MIRLDGIIFENVVQIYSEWEHATDGDPPNSKVTRKII